MESPVTAPVSGHVKRVVVHEGTRWSQNTSLSGLLTVFRQQVTQSTKVISSSKSFISISLEEHSNVYFTFRFTSCLLIRFVQRKRFLLFGTRSPDMM